MIAAEAAQGFGNLQCKECADSIKNALESAGYHGEIVKIEGRWGGRFIVCEGYKNWGETITETGWHVGVRVGNKTFDNHYPDGIYNSIWRQRFDAPGGVDITEITPF